MKLGNKSFYFWKKDINKKAKQRILILSTPELY